MPNKIELDSIKTTQFSTRYFKLQEFVKIHPQFDFFAIFLYVHSTTNIPFWGRKNGFKISIFNHCVENKTWKCCGDFPKERKFLFSSQHWIKTGFYLGLLPKLFWLLSKKCVFYNVVPCAFIRSMLLWQKPKLLWPQE